MQPVETSETFLDGIRLLAVPLACSGFCTVVLPCCLWFVATAEAWYRKRRQRCDLEQLEDNDSVSRWGIMSQLQDWASPSTQYHSQGLTPAEISALHGVDESREAVHDDCSVCLQSFHDGDAVRNLNACGHVFHRACIDLWLLRCASCPLCKCEIGGHGCRT